MTRLSLRRARCLAVSGAVLSLPLLDGCGRILVEQLPEPEGAHTADSGAGPDDELDAAEEPDGSELAMDGGLELDTGSGDAALDELDAQLDDAAPPSDGALEASLDAALDARVDAAADAAVDAAVACTLSGTWAAQVDVQLSWPGGVLAAGSGTLRVWGRAQLTHTGNTVQVALVPCNALVPDFALNPAVANETYGITYPTALFDVTPSPFNPSNASGPVTGALPGGSLALSSLSVLMGANMNNPLTDGWPAVGAVMSNDTDNNGKPAINASYKTGGGYSFPSLNLAQNARSDIAYLAARMNFSSSVSFNSCNAGTGSANVTAFDTHIVGCRVQGTGADCTTAQRDFVDGNRPAYSAGAASMRLSRVANNASCAVVRSALP